MSIEELMRLCPPPARPCDPAAAGRVEEVRQRYGVTLPADYLAFGAAYGTGSFMGDTGEAPVIHLHNPFSRYYLANVDRDLEECRFIVSRFRRLAAALRERSIDVGSLFPLGEDEGNCKLLYVTDPDPRRWRVMTLWLTDDAFDLYDESVTGFLAGYFASRLDVLTWRNQRGGGPVTRYTFDPPEVSEGEEADPTPPAPPRPLTEHPLARRTDPELARPAVAAAEAYIRARGLRVGELVATHRYEPDPAALARLRQSLTGMAAEKLDELLSRGPADDRPRWNLVYRPPAGSTSGLWIRVYDDGEVQHQAPGERCDTDPGPAG
jgi:hypothetical protein